VETRFSLLEHVGDGWVVASVLMTCRNRFNRFASRTAELNSKNAEMKQVTQGELA